MSVRKSKEEIAELVNAYASAVDGCDADAWAYCFTLDGVLRDGVEVLVARQDRARFADGLAAGTRHFLSGITVEVDGDRAVSRCSFQVVATRPEGPEGPEGPAVIARVGEYRDRLRRVDGRWLIEERVVALERPVRDDPEEKAVDAGTFAESALTPMEPSDGTYKVTVPAGPLWNNDHAQEMGPMIAASRFGRFTGQWRTMVWGRMSVVEIELSVGRAGETEFTMDVPAGPIWDQADAESKCPAICASFGGTWNGHWNTVVPGRFSVAGCTFTI